MFFTYGKQLVRSFFRKSTGAKQLTDLTPLAVALELFAVSKKMLLAVSASDVLKFTCSNGILVRVPL